MAVLTGSAGVFNHYPTGHMWTGSGEREVRSGVMGVTRTGRFRP